jgi:catechol 2,3-dioxygenase-like lactoylglutathione lyase family enzyme
MKLEHVALTISDEEEIGYFYQNILGLHKIRDFILKKDLAREIFGIDKETKVFLLQKNELLLELFLMPEQYSHDFKHICISIKNREELIEKAEQNAYQCIRIKREKSDLIFMKDKSGNIFEIIESNNDANKT